MSAETKKESENTRKIAIAFAAFLIIAVVLLIVKAMGLL